MSFTFSARAKEDLKSIADYTEKTWGKKQRNTYLNQFNEAFHNIAERPKTGRIVEERLPEFYKYSIGKHMIIYRRKSPSSVRIIRILHSSMDIISHLH